MPNKQESIAVPKWVVVSLFGVLLGAPGAAYAYVAGGFSDNDKRMDKIELNHAELVGAVKTQTAILERIEKSMEKIVQ